MGLTLRPVAAPSLFFFPHRVKRKQNFPTSTMLSANARTMVNQPHDVCDECSYMLGVSPL